MADLFRKEAVDGFSSKSDMNKSVRAVGIKTAAFIAALAVCAALFALWLIFGTIYETVTVAGIVRGADTNGTVYASFDGTVTKTVATVGSNVRTGDIIAVMPCEDILNKIASAKANGASENEIENLYDEYDKKSIIRSNINGIVTSITDENSYVKTGEEIASVLPYDESGNNNTLTAYIPAEDGGLVAVGMDAQVMPDFTAREENGYIKAYVSAVGKYPVTGQSIKEKSPDLFLPSFDERENYLQLEITFIPDANNESRLKWSNPKSGDIQVAMGTMCAADIVIKKCRPYEWLF